jgi:oligopeptide/dipeptide ABC transporter ATP-binding protein
MSPSATGGSVRPNPLLEIEDLKVEFRTDEGVVHAVDGVSFSMQDGEVLSIVGESGSGKSVTAMTILGLTRGPNARITGSVRYHGTDLTTASSEELQAIRGDRIAMVFQDPMSSFNPVQRIGDQIVEAIQAHMDISDEDANRKAVESLGSVGIPDAETRARHYPFEFSGGMRQRAMIAMALALEPAILIADEPSTALDVTIQAQILELLQELNEERGLSVILITHDLGVVAEVADRVLVMYAGEIVEQGTLDEIFYDPQHPYTWGLLGSLTRLDRERPERLPQIAGQPPSLLSLPAGCRFRPRCPHAFEKCLEPPALEQRLPKAGGHADRCWLDPQDKRKLREVEEGGRIGLEVPA